MNAENLNIETDSLETIIKSLGQLAVDFGVKLIAAILILIFGMWLANRLTRGLKNLMEQRKMDGSLQSFFVSSANILLKILVVIVVLTTVGVHMTSIIAVLGAASLAVGMALSGTLQNVAGGIVILMFKPFKVGDVIEIGTGESGVVKKIMIFTTEVQTFDNQIVFFPNSSLSNGVITNLSRGDIRRTDLKIGIAYGTKIETARKILLSILEKEKRILKNKLPEVFISDLGDSAVVLTIRYWTKFEDLYAVKSDVLEKIYKELPAKKIDIPYQQMDVRIIK